VLVDKYALRYDPLGCEIDFSRMSRRADIPCLLLAMVLTVGAPRPAAGQDAQNATACVAVGDVVQVTVFEQVAGSDRDRPDNFVTLPAQTVGSKGTFSVPYAGEINAAGRPIAEIEREIGTRLANYAIVSGVLVRRLEQNPTGRCFGGLEGRRLQP
jgi:protein involved in polysaccharide export with SLBB domain